MRRRCKASWAGAFFLILALTACGNAAPKLDFRFSDVEPESAASYSPNDTKPLRVAVAAVISPKGTVESYGDLLAYIGRKLNRRVELVQRQTYAEVNGVARCGLAATLHNVADHHHTDQPDVRDAGDLIARDARALAELARAESVGGVHRHRDDQRAAAQAR